MEVRTKEFLERLHRGGDHNYLWIADGSVTTWYEAEPPPHREQDLYFNVNPCREIPTTNGKGEPKSPSAVRGRREHVAAINCLFADFDAKDYVPELQDEAIAKYDVSHFRKLPGSVKLEIIKAGWPKLDEHISTLVPQPSVKINSGGGYHCYWLLDKTFHIETEDDRSRADALQKAWVKYVGSDVANDLPRVLRLPGTLNTRYDPPQRVELVDESGHTHALEELEERCEEWTSASDSRGDAIVHRGVGSLWDLNEHHVRDQLKQLAPGRIEDYNQWVCVGMALHHYGDEAFDLWNEWSSSYATHSTKECRDKWAGFDDEEGGVTPRSLKYWIEEDRASMLGLKTAAPWKESWTMEELMETYFAPTKWIVPNILPEGLTFLAGRPKTGKSWLAYQLAIAAGSGGRFLGFTLQKRKVLYLALEDSPLRLQTRAKKLRVSTGKDLQVRIYLEWPQFDKGGLQKLSEAIKTESYDFVIIDTLSRIAGRSDQLSHRDMTALMVPIQRLAQSNGITILLIDHNKKMSLERLDAPIEDLLGSTAKAALCDNLLGIYPSGTKRVLKLVGRDVDNDDIKLAWDRGGAGWILEDELPERVRGGLELTLVDTVSEMEEENGPPGLAEIVERVDKSRSTVRRAILSLVAEGKLQELKVEGTKKLTYTSVIS